MHAGFRPVSDARQPWSLEAPFHMQVVFAEEEVEAVVSTTLIFTLGQAGEAFQIELASFWGSSFASRELA